MSNELGIEDDPQATAESQISEGRIPEGHVVELPRSSRRHMLLVPALTAVTAFAAACTAPPPPEPPAAPVPPPPPPPPPPGVMADAEVAVAKLTFGPKPGLVDEVRAMGVTAWIEQQLSPGSLPNAETRLAGAPYQTLRNTNLANYDVQNTVNGQDRLFDEMDHANLQRAIFSDQQLFEVMCDFWANHFNIWRRHTWMGFLRTRDHETVVRANALGRFSDMLSASAHSPAMLDYLDNLPNDASTPGGVNQNYARELMELHSLGIINGEQAYTEADVQAVAQIISGWAIEWTNGSPSKYDFKFLPWQHSLTAVTAFGGAINVPVRSYGQGYDDGVAVVTYLAHHPATARYICWKLCRRFISDDPPMDLVDSAAAVFTANDTAIVPTLRHIFGSTAFAASAGSKVRRPLEHLVACLRALNATMSSDPQGVSANALRSALEDMGQPLFERATPDGYPDISPYWASSDGLLNRWEVAGKVARNSLSSQTNPIDRILVDLTALLPNPLPATVADLLGWIGVQLANITLPAADISDLCAALSISGSAGSSTLSTNTSKLPLAVGLILSHPTFQRR